MWTKKSACVCDVLVSDVCKVYRPDFYGREPKRCGTDLVLFCRGSNKNAYLLIWSDVVGNRRSIGMVSGDESLWTKKGRMRL